ncbi:MAG: glycosyltransferase, partial [Acidimicrobiia bacterium]|nr:glycosyltransferase [Acidimicrobiia bacterium]
VVELARALLRREDVELTLLVRPTAVDYARGELGLPAGRIVVAPTRRTLANSLCERTGLGIPALRRGFDIVHGTKHLLPASTTATTLLTVHDMTLVERPRDFAPLKRHLLARPYLASLRCADVLVAVSRAAAGQVAAHLPAAPAKTEVVPLAVAPALLTATPVPVPGLDPSRAALVVSDFSPRKNLPFILRCWPQVQAAREGATLAIVGPPPRPGSPGARALTVARRDIAGGVVHLGHVSDAQLRWLYERAQVTICPSLVEGFGLPALEAVTFSSPVLTSTDPALAEASAGRATAIPIGDEAAWVAAIVTALAAPRPASTRPAEARSWDQVAEETVAAARSALQARALASVARHHPTDHERGVRTAPRRDRLGAL